MHVCMHTYEGERERGEGGREGGRKEGGERARDMCAGRSVRDGAQNAAYTH
jgi:hypothetical protein